MLCSMDMASGSENLVLFNTFRLASMATLSVVVITRNEERNLAACLDSAPFADEIVIVDDGSTDSTLEVGRRYTDRIFERRLDGGEIDAIQKESLLALFVDTFRWGKQS